MGGREEYAIGVNSWDIHASPLVEYTDIYWEYTDIYWEYTDNYTESILK